MEKNNANPHRSCCVQLVLHTSLVAREPHPPEEMAFGLGCAIPRSQKGMRGGDGSWAQPGPGICCISCGTSSWGWDWRLTGN